ncbi:DUF1990 family protein [Saccharopolyspora elongata]|uniref:DUF1990 family protein n=1 Tax=Saccharopolyspora elongata TaxID=2530387 RepID=A0A4R4YCS7_9PSEU|nr:DUF1990 family protein [Saccharopolyspora elongata]
MPGPGNPRERSAVVASKGSFVRRALAVARLLLGMALISWRYLWQITPLHRSEECGDESDLPPALSDDLIDERCQLVGDGTGQLFHRTFSVRIEAGDLDAPTLMAVVMTDLNRAFPREVATVQRTRGREGGLRVGDELVVRMPGPWNAPVRVVACENTSFRMVTLRGHLEAGQIEFRAWPEEEAVRFEIEAWARPSTRLVNLLYARARLAKEMQLNMWVRCCLRAADLAHGRARGGVHIHTRRTTTCAQEPRAGPDSTSTCP